MLKDYEDGLVEPEAFQAKIDPALISDLQRREAESSNRLYVFVKLPILGSKIVYTEYVHVLHLFRSHLW